VGGSAGSSSLMVGEGVEGSELGAVAVLFSHMYFPTCAAGVIYLLNNLTLIRPIGSRLVGVVVHYSHRLKGCGVQLLFVRNIFFLKSNI